MGRDDIPNPTDGPELTAKAGPGPRAGALALPRASLGWSGEGVKGGKSWRDFGAAGSGAADFGSGDRDATNFGAAALGGGPVLVGELAQDVRLAVVANSRIWTVSARARVRARR
jgi:hypothetical protein